MRWLLILMTLCFTSVYALDASQFSSATDEQRFFNLTKEIRCVVCQNQSIADSNAPLANDLRNKVQQMVIANKSDTEIKEYLVQRYGEFILMKPRLNENTLLLWFFPILAIIMAGFVLYQNRKNIRRSD